MQYEKLLTSKLYGPHVPYPLSFPNFFEKGLFFEAPVDKFQPARLTLDDKRNTVSGRELFRIHVLGKISRHDIPGKKHFKQHTL